MFARVGKQGPIKNITSFKRCHEITHGIKEKDVRDRYSFDKPLSVRRDTMKAVKGFELLC